MVDFVLFSFIILSPLSHYISSFVISVKIYYAERLFTTGNYFSTISYLFSLLAFKINLPNLSCLPQPLKHRTENKMCHNSDGYCSQFICMNLGRISLFMILSFPFMDMVCLSIDSGFILCSSVKSCTVFFL